MHYSLKQIPHDFFFDFKQFLTCTLVTAAILLVFNPAAELKILMRIPTKEAKTEIEPHLEAAETKLLVQCNVKP